MFSSKFTVLPIIGLIGLAFIVPLSYFNDSIFMEQLLPSTFILSLVFLIRILGRTR